MSSELTAMVRWLRACWPRAGFRTFLLLLCGFYLFLIFFFHSSLQEGKDAPRRRSPHDRQDIFEDIRAGDAKKNVLQDHVRKVKGGVNALNGAVVVNGAVVKSTPTPSPSTTTVYSAQKPIRDAEETCVGEETEEFVFRHIGTDVLLFSAFWDERENDFDNKNAGTRIRVMALVRRGPKPELSCAFPPSAPDRKPVASRIHFYEMCENHGRPWGSYVLSCPVPPHVQGVPPCTVKVMKAESSWFGSGPYEALVSVRPLKPVPKPLPFSVCIPPLFGTVSVDQLTEFVEVSRVLGAEHFTFYDFNIGAEARAALDYYANQGVVHVVPWLLPHEVNSALWYYGQMLAIQDCLYRSMRYAHFVTFNDIDEYIVPHDPKLTSWGQLVERLAQPKQVGFCFVSAFFDALRMESPDHELDGFPVLQTRVRMRALSHVRTKCMVQAYEVFEQGIHHVSKPIWADHQIAKVDDRVAFLHHYRKCMNNFGQDCLHTVEDHTMLNYSHLIKANILRARREITLR